MSSAFKDIEKGYKLLPALLIIIENNYAYRSHSLEVKFNVKYRIGRADKTVANSVMFCVMNHVSI